MLNLEFNSLNRRFEWQTPEDTENCQIRYQIDFDNGHTPSQTDTVNEYFAFPIYSCTNNNIIVTTWIGFMDEIGGSVSDSHYEPVPGKPI